MQNARIIEFYEKQPGVYFRLKVNGIIIGSNNQKDNEKPNKEESKTKIEELLSYTKHNDKIEIETSNSQNLQTPSVWVTYQTTTGERENKSLGAVAGFGNSEPSFMQGFNQGYAMGKEAGIREAENKHILEKFAALEAGGGKKGIDAQPILEAMMSSEKGIELMDKITKKLGLQ